MSPRDPKSDLLGFLGLAHRAGSVVRGTEAVRTALRNDSVHLVLLAGDASETQTQKLRGLLEGRGVPHAKVATRAVLGDALGVSPTSAAAVTDASFAAGLRKRLDAAGMPVR